MKTKAGLLAALLVSAAMMAPAHAASHMTGSIAGMHSSMLEGREVIGKDGQSLGYVLAVNDRARMIELQTPGGIGVSLSESRLRRFGANLVANNMNRDRVQAMERRQAGRTVAINIDLNHRHFGG